MLAGSGNPPWLRQPVVYVHGGGIQTSVPVAVSGGRRRLSGALCDGPALAIAGGRKKSVGGLDGVLPVRSEQAASKQKAASLAEGTVASHRRVARATRAEAAPPRRSRTR